MRMEFLPITLISFLLLLPSSTPHSINTFFSKHIPNIQYHNGPLLTGKIKLSILWYGGKVPEAFDSFIQSLKPDTSITFDPKVSDWWKKVESFQSIASSKSEVPRSRRPPPPGIDVEIVSKVDDEKMCFGENITNLNQTVPELVKKATNGNPDGSTVAVIVFGERVTLPCDGGAEAPCFEHGVILNKQIYIVIKNQLRKCGWTCAFPFHKHPKLLQNGVNLVVDPPTSDEAAHLSIIHFASALASTVTNPYGNGFHGNHEEVGTCCSKAFGRGYLPGFTGRIYVDPQTGGAFNVHGVNDTRFMIPGLWNPADSSKCWTLL